MAERQLACHRCMQTTTNGTAVSRVDNKTPLCTQCEQAEAIEDLLGTLMPKEDWVYVRLSRRFGIEPVPHTDLSGNRPEEVTKE